jgi:2-dehydro-3-deoxy-D-arabinonate dehydratase
MRFGQIKFENKVTAALFEGDEARPIPGYSVVGLIRKAEVEAFPLADLAAQMAIRHREQLAPVIPLHPVEVWVCGRACEQTPTPAPSEIFFKGTSRVCVGPDQPVGIRFDSKFTAPGPTLALVLGREGNILGYTLGNDVSARDIQYPAQSKIYTGSCALGPVIVTPDELAGADGLELSCTVLRNGEPRFSASANLPQPAEVVPMLVEHLLRANPVPAGSVLMFGPALCSSAQAALEPGDTVVVRLAQIGELRNPVSLVQ